MSPTFRSLAIPGYRTYAGGALVSNVGTWMARVGQDWLVLTQLTDGSAIALGAVTGLQFLPFLLLAPWAGVVADRFPKRRVLLVTQSLLAVSSLLLAGLVFAGVVQLWHVFALALLQGCATAVDSPARQSFVSELVPREALSNAVSLNSASFNGGRLLGPAVAGVLIAGFGTGITFLVNGLSFVTVLVALLRLRPEQIAAAEPARGRGGIRDGLRYVRGRPDLTRILALVFVLGTFGMNFQVTIALMATAEFGKGPTEFGALGSLMAVGSLAGALLAARRARPRLRVLLLALCGFTVAASAAALAPTYLLFGIVLVGCGVAAMTAMTTANALVQLSVAPQLRGRVMALYMALFMGGTPVGAPVVGWIGDTLGPRWALAIGPIAVGVIILALGIDLARRHNVRVSYRGGRSLQILVGNESSALPGPPSVVRSRPGAERSSGVVG